MCYRRDRRLLFRAMLAPVLLASLASLAACGGSSSETPPPLQPDPTGFRYAPPIPAAIPPESDAGDAAQTIPETGEVDPKPRLPARPPTGSSPAAH